jgi:hypothetical protein
MSGPDFDPAIARDEELLEPGSEMMGYATVRLLRLFIDGY